jgi:palmitoyltransferase ZDHHC9/14/18
MASRQGSGHPNASSGVDDSFPQYPRSDVPGPPSIISSRMTDIASEDGGDREPQRGFSDQRRSTLASDALSRPGTARTGISSRGPWPQAPPPRRGVGKRGSAAGSVSSSNIGGRPASSTSRSHVPSLTSHAFFHPMSSQKLQAQRGHVSRPSTMGRQVMTQDDVVPQEGGNNTARNSLISNPVGRLARQLTDEGEGHPPPSRGTEGTEPEMYDRVTANTSPTQGHYPAGSLTESVRPLHKKPGDRKKLAIDTDKGYKPSSNLPPPMRTPRSFRSSFLLPSRNDSGQFSSRGEMQGVEKLDSVASSPQLPHPDHPDGGPMGTKGAEKSRTKLGHNFEYFEGNTVFCLGGRFQNSRDRPVNIATGALVILPGILFFVFSAPWIWDHISPAIPITFAYLYYICVSSFLHASASNPGVSNSIPCKASMLLTELDPPSKSTSISTFGSQ